MLRLKVAITRAFDQANSWVERELAEAKEWRADEGGETNSA